MSATIVYEDQFGAMIDYPADDYIEIRWYDATASLDGEAFNHWLDVFADRVEQCRRSGILVDAIQFAMPMERMDVDWRDANIVPRYNAAGVKRFAFLMPTGMPAIGNPPEREGPAQYPTGYFGTRATARQWLAS